MRRALPWLCGLLLLASGCAAPEISMNREAERLGLIRSVARGTQFQHVVYRNRAQTRNRELHVYLDGDGSPWERRNRIADNPTPRDPLVLRLMALDTAAALYLGRPCYLGFSTTPPCSAEYWTAGRFSATVVDSLAAALQALQNDLQPETTVLIGFSGGGALAMLLAERLQNISGVVTLAGNLDTAAWTKLHGYSPLTGSENPARHPPLPANIFQLHVAGAEDDNVPPDLIRAAVKQQPSAQVLVLPRADHNCCWEQHWPALLEQINTRQ